MYVALLISDTNKIRIRKMNEKTTNIHHILNFFLDLCINNILNKIHCTNLIQA